MPLRRVIEHGRKQEWTAIAIDFVIIVAGVFVGIQAANWNEVRADQSRARSYRERIHSDVEAPTWTCAMRLRIITPKPAIRR